MSIRTEQVWGISVHYLEMSYWEQAVQLIKGKKSIGEIAGINSEIIMDFPPLGLPNFCRLHLRPKFKFLRAKFEAEVK